MHAEKFFVYFCQKTVCYLEKKKLCQILFLNKNMIRTLARFFKILPEGAILKISAKKSSLIFVKMKFFQLERLFFPSYNQISISLKLYYSEQYKPIFGFSGIKLVQKFTNDDLENYFHALLYCKIEEREAKVLFLTVSLSESYGSRAFCQRSRQIYV